MLVGTAEILVVANTEGFRKQLEEDTAPAFGGLKSDAETAGEDLGSGLRTGVKDEAGKLENDLGDIGAVGGTNLRDGVHGETDKLAGDLENDGTAAGEGLHKGISSGLSDLANLISNTGLPLGALTESLEKGGDAAEEAGSKVAGLGGSLATVGGPVAAVGAALAAAGVVAVDMAEHMQTADAAIAAAAGTSVAAGKAIGDAFLGTAGQSEFSGEEMATAFATVAGQLKSTEGHALDAAQALQVMNAAGDLATAKQIDLGTATSTVAGVMQAFQLSASSAAHVSDVLFQASTATGQSVDALGASLEKVRSKLGDTSGGVGDLAAVLVDMTDQGVTGRAAMAALNTAMNSLTKTSTGVQTAISDQKAAYDQMSPSLKKLADQYRSGTITSKDFTSATQSLSPAQAQLVASFTSATDAVGKAQLKFKEMGVTVFNAKGDFVGMGSIIDQLHPKFERLDQAQQLAAASALFGAGAARQMIAIIDAGPAAFDKASNSVNKMGAAHAAAAKESHTLSVEMKTLGAAVEDLGTQIGQVLIPAATFAVGALLHIGSAVGDVIDFIEANWQSIIPILLGPIGLAVDAFVTFKGTIESIFNTVVSFIQNAWNTVKGATTTVVSTIGALFSALPGRLQAFFSTIVAAINGAWNTVRSATSSLVSAITGFFATIPGKALNAAQAIVGDMAGLWSKIQQAAGAAVSSIAGAFQKLPGEILGVLAGLPSAFVNLGRELVNGLISGIESAPGSVAHAIESLIPGGGAIGKVAKLLGLAEGGIVTSPTLAVVGEAGPEAVIPLGKVAFSGVQPLPSALQAASSSVNSRSTTNAPTINFNIYGNGQMTAGQMLTEAAFAIRSGALPVAAPIAT